MVGGSPKRPREGRSCGFTLVELMVAIGVFAVICTVIYQVSGSFTKQATKGIEKSGSVSDISQVLFRLQTELSTATQLYHPFLKVNTSELDFRFREKRFKYEFSNNTLYRYETGDTPSAVCPGIDSIRFYRPEDKLLDVHIEAGSLKISTSIYLETLQ